MSLIGKSQTKARMYWITTHLEIVIAVLLVLIAAVFLLQQRRTPQSTFAWLLAIGILPYLAVPLFLALGFRKRGTRFVPIAFLQRPVNTTKAISPTDHLLQNLDLPAASPGNKFTLLDDGQRAWSGLIEVVTSAKLSLDVQFYIVANDPVGVAFVEALTAKARAGVRVRLLLDRLGTLYPPQKTLRQLKQAGGEVLYFSPFLLLPAPGHLNLRNHRKLVIADGVRAFSGGMNVGDHYMGPTVNSDGWTDLAFLLEGPAVSTCHDVFLSDWSVAGGEGGRLGEVAQDVLVPTKIGNATVQTVPSGPDLLNDPMHDALVYSIHTAQDRVWIATPYFLPTELLGHALTVAARRGVDVRIVLPQKSNQRLADFARGAYLREMSEAGIKVMFFQDRMIHAKAGVIDEMAFVGSANFDVRSMLLNFELSVFLYDTRSVAEMVKWYQRQETTCVEGMGNAGLVRRVLEGFFRLGAPVL